MKFYFLIVLLAALTSLATEPKGCSNVILGLIREIPLEITPTYFIRVESQAEKIFMSGNCVASLKDGKCLSKNYVWEPYPIAGMNILTIPHCDNKRTMCFYSTDAFEGQDESKPFLIDAGMDGYYQSFGFLNKNKKNKTANVRILSYYGRFRDYQVSDKSVKPRGEAKAYCPGVDLKMPMISKDGKTIAGWDLGLGKTRIYNLAEDGKCSPFYTLDYMVGKMDFSYDNKYAAFHVTSNSAGNIMDDITLNQQIFVMELKTKKIHKLTFGTSIIYYPHFAENGHLYALKKNGTKFSVLEIDINKALQHTSTEGQACVNCTAKQQAQIFKIGCE